MKGLEIEYSRILIVFSIIDLSSNNFQGEIPKSIEKLNLLRMSFRAPSKPIAASSTFRQLQKLNLAFNHVRFSRISSKFGSLMNHLNLSNFLFSDAFKTKSKVPFTKLRIIDISYNEFSGLWPTNYIEKSEATMNVDEHAMKLKYMGDIYYYDYVQQIYRRDSEIHWEA
ncbi:hypothetical protein ACSBR2_039019 [Camellia fascicularis]